MYAFQSKFPGRNGIGAIIITQAVLSRQWIKHSRLLENVYTSWASVSEGYAHVIFRLISI